MSVKAQLLIRLGPFYLSTRNSYVSWGRWGMWIHPFDRFYPWAVQVTRFGPHSKTWTLPRARAKEGGS